MAILTPMPVMQFFDSLGNPLAGGKLYTYEAGTTTLLATYTDQTGDTANTNPVILDSAGRANIWLDTTQLYYWELDNANDVQVWTADNVGSIVASADVEGPASSTDNAVVRFNGVTGKVIQNSTVTISDGGAIAASSLSLNTALPLASGGTGSTTASGARTNFGLGVLATKGDGDYGDITVSASGATWTIDNDAVTRVKIINGAVNGAKLSGAQAGDAPVYGARAWGSFGGVGSVTINASGNISSIVRNSTGNYTINFATAMQDAGYAVCISFAKGPANPVDSFYVTTFSASGFTVQFYTPGTGPTNDVDACFFTVFR